MKLFVMLARILSVGALVVALANCASRYEATTGSPVTEPPEVQRVIITGSRLKRTEIESSVPVVIEQREENIQVADGQVGRSDESIQVTIFQKKTTLSSQEKADIYRVIDMTPQASYQVFKRYRVNPTISTLNNPVSTFSMDADNGSYKLAKAMLNQGQLPNADGIRIEEFVNAFDYQYRQSNDLFSVSAEVMPSPFRNGYHVLHIGVQTKTLSDNERNPTNIVMVADVSGSMGSDNKIELLKDAMTTLTSQLNSDDTIALVTYNEDAEIALYPTLASNKRAIFQAINKLKPGGSTNAEKGLQLGYELANKMFKSGYNNRVILTSDGMANVGSTSPDNILKKIEDYKAKGIFLTTLGVGVGMYNDYLLEQLADRGNGNYLYIANQQDIQNTFVDQLNKQLQTVAKDAKIQVQFNPERVKSYRLIGYENRHLNKEDFNDPNKDGGELGAGHTVTALYELKLNKAPEQQDKSLGKISIAYKKPQGQKVNYINKQLPSSITTASLASATADSRLSYGVAAFGEKLRQSYWARTYSYSDIDNLLASLPNSYLHSNQVKELRKQINIASQLDYREDPFEEKYPKTSIDFDRVPLLD